MGENSHIDMDVLSTLQEVMEEDFPVLLDTFLNDSSMRLKDLKQAVAARDTDFLRRCSHSFKGSSSNVGARRLAVLCERMEKKGLLGELTGVEELLVEIETEFKGVEADLAQL